MYKKILQMALFASLFSGGAVAQIQTTAKQGYIYDISSNTVLLNKNGDSRIYPASMTKMMTVYMIFERLKNKTLLMDDTFEVSKKAWKKGGSKMFVRVNNRVTVRDLLRGVIVQSGNDAAIVLAEGIAETEESFAELMNVKALELGMQNTHFMNATGWPDKNHYTTAKDLSILGQAMIKNFPEYYPMWAERSFKYAGIKQYNRNPLLSKNVGADGLKTGHTNAAGYGLTGTFKVGERRLIMVLNGMKSKKERIVESTRLARSALYDYKIVEIVKPGLVVDNIAVWMANTKSVPLITKTTLKRTVRKSLVNKIKTTIQYATPVQAPIRKGDVLGRIVVEIPGEEPLAMPLFAGANVHKPGLFNRIINNFNYIVWGAM